MVKELKKKVNQRQGNNAEGICQKGKKKKTLIIQKVNPIVHVHGCLDVKAKINFLLVMQ